MQKRGSGVNADDQYAEVRTGQLNEQPPTYAAVQKPRKNNGHGAPDEYAVVDKSKKKKVRVLVSGRLTQTVYTFCLFACLLVCLFVCLFIIFTREWPIIVLGLEMKHFVVVVVVVVVVSFPCYIFAFSMHFVD